MRVEKAKVGFTLVEMAVVLVIIGLILTVTMPLLTEGIKRDKLTKDRKGVSSLRDEIIGYALTHDGVLPTLSKVATFASAEDPWGNLIAYWSDPEITEGAATDICTLSSAPNNLSLHDNNSGNTYTGVAFIIAGRGANQNLQVGYAAGPPVQIDTYANGFDMDVATDHDHTLGAGALGANYDVTPERADRFDDAVQYVTYNYLRTRICTPEFGDEKAHAAVTFDSIGENFDTGVNAGGTGGSFANLNDAIKVDANTNEVSLGNDAANGVGCLWWNGENASLCVLPNADGETTDPGNPTTYLGRTGLCSNSTWTKARFVFKFSVTSTDEHAQSFSQRGGFVFTFMGVGTGVNDGGLSGAASADAPCGQGGSYLGYTNYYPSGVSTGPPLITYPKYGVETDYCAYRTGVLTNDPAGVDMTASHDPTTNAATDLGATEYPNHIAVVFWGTQSSITDDLQHGVGVVDSAASPFNPTWGTTTYDEYTASGAPDSEHAQHDGFITNATYRPQTTGLIRTNWLEDTRDHWVRIVYERVESGATAGWDAADKVRVHVWVSDSPSAAFKNVGADLVPQDPHGQIGYNLYENSTRGPAVGPNGVGVDNFRFGWTTSSGSADGVSTTILSDFAFNLGN